MSATTGLEGCGVLGTSMSSVQSQAVCGRAIGWLIGSRTGNVWQCTIVPSDADGAVSCDLPPTCARMISGSTRRRRHFKIQKTSLEALRVLLPSSLSQPVPTGNIRYSSSHGQ